LKVELFYFDGCPNWSLANERLQRALTIAGRGDVGVRRRRVETAKMAEEVGFIGSPTVRVDGCDPFAAGDEEVGMTCRVYATPAGLSGSPTLEQFIEVVS